MDEALRAAAADRLYVVTPEGRALGGAAALLLLAEKTGRLPRWLAVLLRIEPVLWVLERAYDVMARNRRLFAKFLFRSDRGPFAAP